MWLVADQHELTLVDTGVSVMSPGILKFIDSLKGRSLTRILLTHGHADHVGSVDKIVSRQAIPVYAHEVEIPYINGELPYPRRKKSESNVKKDLVQPLSQTTDGDLNKVAGLKPYHTPGHSPGHVVYYHEQDGVLLAGDLFTSKHGKLRRPMPMFTADMTQAVRSSAVVAKVNPQRLEVCHGDAVLHPTDHLDEYVRTMEHVLSSKL